MRPLHYASFLIGPPGNMLPPNLISGNEWHPLDGYLNSNNAGAGALENISIGLAAGGFTISFDGSGSEDFTTGLLGYTGAGTNLTRVTFEDIDGSSATSNDDRAGFFLDNVIAQGSVIPEPSALLLGALGSLLLLRRHRTRTP